MLSELAEFLESRNWKHWKKGNERDDRNTVTELIDIIHFLSALHIQKRSSVYGELNNNSFIEDSILFASYVEDCHLEMKNMSIKALEEAEFKTIIASLSMLVSTVMCFDLEHENKSNSFIVVEKALLGDNAKNLQKWTAMCFARVLHYLEKVFNITHEDVLAMYLVKNVLNSFRMSHGYAKGEYTKIWKMSKDDIGMEDNDYIYSLVKEKDILSGEVAEIKFKLLNIMEEEYSKIYVGEA